MVIGPEAPLVAGVADELREAGIAVFGPDAQGAQLEGSKTFSKRFMDAHGIPTARYGSFDDLEAALGYLSELEAPVVVKADGLAAGKGVIVAEDKEDGGRSRALLLRRRVRPGRLHRGHRGDASPAPSARCSRS